jgi:uncharacterized membrane protein
MQIINFEQIFNMKERRALKKMFQYFLQGVIILAPIIITIYAVTALFNLIDNILPDIAGRFFPNVFGVDQFGNPKKIPGIGFVVVIATVVLVGYVSSSFIVGRMVELFDTVLERTPGIKIIYSTLKDFFEAFAGNKRKFDKAVLVSIQDMDVWQVGFITQQEVKQFGLEEYVAVYVPKSYAFAGQLYFVKRPRVRLLTNITSAEAMKFAISGGVTELDDDIKISPETA